MTPLLQGELFSVLWHLHPSCYLQAVNKLAPILRCHKTCKIYTLRFPLWPLTSRSALHHLQGFKALSLLLPKPKAPGA